MSAAFTRDELLEIAFSQAQGNDCESDPASPVDPCRLAKARVRAAFAKPGAGSARQASALVALAACLDTHYVHSRHHPALEEAAWLPLRPGERTR